jgi:hypothetical protein
MSAGPSSFVRVAVILIVVCAWAAAASGHSSVGKVDSGGIGHVPRGAASGDSATHRQPATPSVVVLWNWLEASPPTAPSARAGAATTYDAADGYVLLFGGCPYWGGDYWGHVCTALGDTWTLHNGVWTNLTRSMIGPSPPPRIDASIAYDSADGYVVMFGGYDGTTHTVYNDTWTFSAGHWTQVHPASSPPARDGAGMAGDDAYHAVILFGGDSNVTGSLTYFNDTWGYHAGQWSRLSTPVAPPARYDMAMSYDPADLSVLLFGGWSPVKTQSYGDSWSFSNGTWTELSSSFNPPAENPATMAFDPAANAVIMTGGHVGENVSSATWGYSAASGWQWISTTTAPNPRWGLSLSYDPASSTLWLFGGFVAFWNGTGNPPVESYFGDTWEFGSFAGPPPVLYAVTFIEAGLPTGTSWSVTFDSSRGTSTGPTITFYVANGSYVYSVATVAGYSVVPSSGAQLVSGPGASVTVAFTAIAASSTSAAFEEGGLTGGLIVGTVLAAVFLLRPKRPSASGPPTPS